MKIKQTFLAFTLALVAGSVLFAPVVSAEICNPGTDNEYETSVIPCSKDGDSITGLLKMVLRILSALVGVVGVGGILYGAIRYTTAGDSMDQTKEAKKIIFNVIFGLAAYGVGFAFMNFLIPGGLVGM